MRKTLFLLFLFSCNKVGLPEKQETINGQIVNFDTLSHLQPVNNSYIKLPSCSCIFYIDTNVCPLNY
jgi:hypothetical protein